MTFVWGAALAAGILLDPLAVAVACRVSHGRGPRPVPPRAAARIRPRLARVSPVSVVLVGAVLGVVAAATVWLVTQVAASASSRRPPE